VLEELRAECSVLVGEVTHAVLGVVRARAFPLAERIRVAGGDPFEVIEVVVVTLRALADGLAEPSPEWPAEP
jgi:hypothetical protein